MNSTQFRQRRLALKLTQSELAAALGLGKTGDRTIRRIEAGEVKIGKRTEMALVLLKTRRGDTK